MRPACISSIEPAWSLLRPAAPLGVAPPLFDWLRDDGSLTRRVIAACDGRGFRVRLLHQGWGRPLYSEQRLLRMRRGALALIREVELCCDGQPWVFARTLIPVSSLRGAARRLAYLRERPLGAVLFANPATRRGVTQIARLQPGHPLFAAATANLSRPARELWGRRTLFYYADKPLLVNEIFLPDIPCKGR